MWYQKAPIDTVSIALLAKSASWDCGTRDPVIIGMMIRIPGSEPESPRRIRPPALPSEKPTRQSDPSSALHPCCLSTGIDQRGSSSRRGQPEVRRGVTDATAVVAADGDLGVLPRSPGVVFSRPS